MLLVRLKFSQKGQTPRSRSHVKTVDTYRKVLSLEKLIRNIKALTLTISKCLASIKFSKKKKGQTPKGKNVAIHGTHYGKVINTVKVLKN